MLKIAFQHIKTILTHKWYVGKYCFMFGLYWQGLIHDLSKFSPTEFLESIKYYSGTSSPIDACKKDKGYSMAWLHHRGRNPHHSEYWVDNFDKGMTTIKIPWKYMLEMFCDFLGAGIAYSKNKKLNMKSECLWWDNRRKTIVIHPESRQLIDELMYMVYKYGEESITDKTSSLPFLKHVYEDGYFDEDALDWEIFIKGLKENDND